MKKQLSISFLLVAVTLIASHVQAQNRGSWGAEAGVNFANINGDPDFDTSSRIGFMLGGYYKFQLTDGPLYLQPELFYTQKGYEGASGETTYKFDYIAAAALVSYYFSSEKSLTPFAKAGPYLGFNTSSKLEREDGGKRDVEGVNDIEMGVILRAGVQIDQFEVGLRLSQAVTKLADDDDFDAKNFVFGLFAGINF